MKTLYKVEMQRSNITPRSFFTACTKAMQKKGADIADWTDYDSWTNDRQTPYYSKEKHEDWDEPRCEIYSVAPYKIQMFLASAYNFILEFDFDTDKKGSGYLFAVACGARDKAVVKVEETINALPEADQLTLENKEAVAAARAAFDALTEAQQAQVSKAAQDKLAAAEAAIAKLEAAEADKAAAAKVEETINALPAAADITLENKEAVAAARAAFNALTKAQQALVSKEAQDKLTACEARIAELEKPEEPADLPFTDLTQDWYMDSIRYVYEHELMYGTTDTTFAPDDALTRGMFVTMLYRMEGKPEATGNTSFTDVPANMYYAPAIAWASANGVVYGTSETAFSPEGKITREQMAAMMRRYASFKKLDTSAKADLSTFADASAVSAWATGDMQWAVASELLYGNNHNQLQPTANATRAQAAAILQRFATKIVK